MIVKTKTGVQVSGTLAREPEIRRMGGQDVLKLNVKAQSKKGADGKWNSLFVDVLCWDALSERDGMFQKGDFVTAEGREIKDNEYPEGSGKIYYSLRADGLTPGDQVIFRWMQMVIDMAAQSYTAPPPEPFPTNEPTPFDGQAQSPAPTPTQASLEGGQMYEGERLSDYAPRDAKPPDAPDPVRQAAQDGLIDETADDLPF